MPTYQYACTSCGEGLEVVQKFSDEPLTVCPACSGRLRKVFSPVGVVFKGSGFYKTDSRGSPKKKSESGEATKSADKTSDKPSNSSSGSDKSSPSKDSTSAPSAGSKGSSSSSGQVA